jgi:hypothetical protein
MAEAVPLLYTSQTEIERIWSANAVTLRTDEIGSTTDYWDEVNEEATDIVNLYASIWYEESDMYSNRFVRRLATWIGCYLVSLRRGDPGQYYAQYERVIDILEKIQKGILQIPRLGTRADITPALSNMRVDDRFSINKVRVQPSVSTGGTSSRQDLDPQYPAGLDY